MRNFLLFSTRSQSQSFFTTFKEDDEKRSVRIKFKIDFGCLGSRSSGLFVPLLLTEGF